MEKRKIKKKLIIIPITLQNGDGRTIENIDSYVILN